MNTNDVEAITQKLLNGEFDVSLLDQGVSAAYDPVSPHRAAANKALMQLQEAPDLWQSADGIIEKAQNPHSRFFGVQVLDDAIKTRYVDNMINHQHFEIFPT
jgi:exportin-1